MTGGAGMNRSRSYEWLAVATLLVSGIAAILAVAGAALQEELGVAASALCAAAFLVPGLSFLGYARRLRLREAALAQVARFAAGRDTIRIDELAAALGVSSADAERILRTALREGHLRGRFEGPDRFVAERMGPVPREGEP